MLPAYLARLAFQRQFAYRAANLAGLATNVFFGALRAYVLLALFDAQSAERVMMIDHGRLLFDGQLEELRQRFGG